jgi:SAM-dependent methyltransferase
MHASNGEPESEPDYEYKGLIATTWDLLRGDTSNWPDRNFFLNFIHKHGQPALDVGCATGRLLLDYLASGIDIDGVDISPEMLAICREKALQRGLQPALYQQAIETLDLPRKYRSVMVPSSSFQLVTSLDLARQAIHHLFEHLRPGGALAMPFMILWEEGEPTQSEEWRLVAERERPEAGDLVRRWSRESYDVENQLESTEDRYEIIRGGQVIATEQHTRSPATRWYSQEQAANLYREAGFIDIRLLSGFSEEPAAPEDTLFTVVGSMPK